MSEDKRRKPPLPDHQHLIMERLRRNHDGGHFETITEIAQAIGITPGQVLVTMKALERAGRVEVKGEASNGGRTWSLTDAEVGRVL